MYTGQLLELSGSAPGGPAADAELERLKVAGGVEAYNSSYVWVTGCRNDINMTRNVGEAETSGKQRRLYYLDTRFPAFEQLNFDQLLHDNALEWALHNRYSE